MARSASSSQAGFTLVEVLVAIVIFSIGLLGWAGLQLAAIEGSRSAELRTIAMLQAQDLADRIRANMPAVEDGDYAAGVPGDWGCRTVYFDHVADPETCTPSQLAQDDLLDWNIANQQLLPGGGGIVCRDSGANPGDRTPTAPACDDLPTSPYVVIVWWKDPVPRSGVRLRFTELRFQP